MWVKLCGIRDVDTALAAAEAGADAIGLNFFEKSPRCVDVETVRAIATSLPPYVTPVGLFVNHSLRDVVEITETCHLATLQFHGDETPAEIAAVTRERPGLRIIRAFRFDGDLAPLRRELEALAELDVTPTAVLVDANVKGAYGGTGHTVPWLALAESWDESAFPPLILAGGLTPENVAEAIEVVQPWGVDTASGVESVKAVKDRDRMRRFVAAAKDADFS